MKLHVTSTDFRAPHHIANADASAQSSSTLEFNARAFLRASARAALGRRERKSASALREHAREHTHDWRSPTPEIAAHT
eukprot:4967216-Pleurochrysis_carterae.AAC.1